MNNQKQRQQVTALVASAALEANGNRNTAAVMHLVDATGALILRDLQGDAAISMAKIMGRFLVDYVERNGRGAPWAS